MNKEQIDRAARTGIEVLNREDVPIPASHAEGIVLLKSLCVAIIQGNARVDTTPLDNGYSNRA